MPALHLKIITPQKIAIQEHVTSVTVPSAAGEITVLPRHSNLFTLLKEGIVRFKPSSAKGSDAEEKYLAIGGGYLETDGEEVSILVSRAYGQNEIDAERTEQAIEEAKNALTQAKDATQRKEAMAQYRRSIINMKLIKRRKRT